MLDFPERQNETGAEADYDHRKKEHLIEVEAIHCAQDATGVPPVSVRAVSVPLYIRNPRLTLAERGFEIAIRRLRAGAEGEGEIMTHRVAEIPYHGERVSLQSIKDRDWVFQADLYPAGKVTIASMLRKGWIERRLEDASGLIQFRITQAGKAAVVAKIPVSR